MKIQKSKKLHKLPARILAVFFCACLLISLPGCTILPDFPEDPSEIPSSGITVPEDNPGTDPLIAHSFLEEAVAPEYINPHETVIIPETTWEAPKPLLDFSSGLTLEIHNDAEFNEFMEHFLSRRATNFSFYACNGYEINNDILLYRFSLPYVSTTWTQVTEDKVYWDITIRYYPGTYIADAYLSGDTSELDEDELKAYDIAKDFIENTVNKEESFLQKERLIHDFICEKTVYINPKTGEQVPRHCTAVGVLLDGEANCQGYTDCCNMLGRMAGMDVKSQSGFGDGTPHVWNIIRIDRNWYSLDLTYDDTTFEGNGDEYPAYIYFNAGKDILEATHSLRDGSELIPIKDVSDENYFYYSDEFPDGGRATGGEADAISKMGDLMANAIKNGYPYASLISENSYLYSYDIVDPIYDAMKSKGVSDNINIHAYRAGSHTFIMGKLLDS